MSTQATVDCEQERSPVSQLDAAFLGLISPDGAPITAQELLKQPIERLLMESIQQIAQERAERIEESRVTFKALRDFGRKLGVADPRDGWVSAVEVDQICVSGGGYPSTRIKALQELGLVEEKVDVSQIGEHPQAVRVTEAGVEALKVARTQSQSA